MSNNELGNDGNRCNRYDGSSILGLLTSVRSLNPKRTDAIIDLGCGKGGSLIALRHIFGQVAGVEISPKLAAIARKNLEVSGCNDVVVMCYDAGGFTDLDAYNWIYMFNPFPGNVMREVVQNLETSLRRRPRQVTVLYANPFFVEELERSDLLKYMRRLDYLQGLVVFVSRGVSA